MKDVKVDAINLYGALLSFSQFLNLQSSSCLLVAHNAYFDKSRFMNAITKNNLTEKFSIINFADTLTLFKKEMLDQKGQKEAYKLSNLAHDIVGIDLDATFHETMYDVKIL